MRRSRAEALLLRRAAGAKARVFELLQFVRGYDREKAGSRPELVIDGRTLGFVLGKPYSSSALNDMPCCCR